MSVNRSARDQALLELIRRDEVVRVLDALAGAGVAPILFKGTALAYSLYPDPGERPRLDTDVLIRPTDIHRAASTFEQLGYRLAPRTSGEHVTHQATYVSDARWGLPSAFDVHWKVADPHAFADLFPYEELDADAAAVPRLGAHARTVSDVHALLIACTHRIAHHFDRDVPIFARDIDLLARRMGDDGWSRVARIAGDKGIRAVVLRGLDQARARFATPVPAGVVAELSTSGADEPTAAFLGAHLRKVDVLRSDLRTLRGWQRLRLLREHLLPPPRFVLSSYPNSPPVLLPALYVHRVVTGARRWFRPLR